MLRCCMHCNHTGNFVHESGWACRKHDFWVNLNNLDSLKKVFECKDCRLDLDDLFRIGVKGYSISIEYVLKDNAHVHNDIMIYYKEGEHPRKPHVNPTSSDMVEKYVVYFNDFPVYRTHNPDVIKFIKKGFNFKV